MSVIISIEDQMLLLQEELNKERQRSQELADRLAAERIQRKNAEDRLMRASEKLQRTHAQAEREEEGFVNQILSQIVSPKKERKSKVVDLDSEGEFITNNLQRHMSSLRVEKNTIESEVKELRKQIHGMQKEKEYLARQVEEEEENLSLSFLKKLRDVNLEKSELEFQLNKARISLSSRDSRSSSFDQLSMSFGSTTESVMSLTASSIVSALSVDELSWSRTDGLQGPMAKLSEIRTIELPLISQPIEEHL